MTKTKLFLLYQGLPWLVFRISLIGFAISGDYKARKGEFGIIENMTVADSLI